MKAAVAKVAPSVVQIETSGGSDIIGSGSGGQQIRKGTGPTTGLIVSDDGYLISSAEDMSHYLLAQVNDGRYGSTAVLSPQGIATLHAPAAPTGAGWEPHTAYAMGWYNGTINGVPAIYHGGDILNFHSDMFISLKTTGGPSF